VFKYSSLLISVFICVVDLLSVLHVHKLFRLNSNVDTAIGTHFHVLPHTIGGISRYIHTRRQSIAAIFS